jgi:hypothetical protein
MLLHSSVKARHAARLQSDWWRGSALDRDRRRRRRLPLLQVAGVDVLDQVRVRLNRLLLEVAHDAVAVLGRHEVGEEEEVAVGALREEDHGAHDQACAGGEVSGARRAVGCVMALQRTVYTCC